MYVVQRVCSRKILDSRWWTCVRQFLIRWKGYSSSDYDTWEPRGLFHPKLITEYEKQNGCYDYDWQHRCPTCDCDLPFSSNHAVRIHLGWKISQNTQNTRLQPTTRRYKAVQKEKKRLQQSDPLDVECEGEKMGNVYNFLYLGFFPQTDDNQEDRGRYQ